ncbi:MAG: VapC toxin family PIN domain ribonuclease, partial [Verrucomicrobiota bacterium]
RKEQFQNWLSTMKLRMKGRILTYNMSVANVWGQLLAKCETEGVRLPGLDSLLAATAIRHSLVMVTRNENDFKNAGVKVINPFSV